MENNIKSKNIKFNMDTDDKLIVDYFDTHKEKFSTVVKMLLMEYVTESKNNGSKSIMDVLEEHTKLLEKIVEKGMIVSNKTLNNSLEEKENVLLKEKIKEEIQEGNQDKDFNIDFLRQI